MSHFARLAAAEEVAQAFQAQGVPASQAYSSLALASGSAPLASAAVHAVYGRVPYEVAA